MRSFVRAIAAVAALAVSPFVAEAAPESRLALVIGNARYPDAPLRNPANDARAMATTLRGQGFEVILQVDASKQQMESAIIEFGEKLSQGATGLFFFAGHGMQVNGRNYIIPTDARLSSEQRVKLETIDIDAVLDQMQGARSKVNVVILDACRNNPFERRFRSTSGGLAQINAPEGTLIAYSTAPGRVAADGEGANGLYTSELLKALRAPGMKLEDVFKQVRINVARASNGAQTPWEASSLVGDFYFVPPAPLAAAATPSKTIELELWHTIRNTSDPGEYRAYLARYPKGEFADIAEMRIASLEKSRADAVEKARQDAADRARLEAAEKARAEAADKARADAVEKARLEIEQIRREMAERSRVDAQRVRTDAAEKARLDAADKTRLDAAEKALAGVSAAAPQDAGVRFDGVYRAKFTLIAQDGFTPIDGTLKVNGGTISGFGAAGIGGTNADTCAISGLLDPETGTIIHLGVTCRRLSAHLTGRFADNPQNRSTEARTEARALSDGRVVPITWVRDR